MAETTDNPPSCKPRWYSPTPAKFLFAVLAMQSVLFLSTHYRWCWLNERKGWPVLITVAATAGALVLLLATVVASRFRKSKSQFGLATLLLMVPLTAIPCGWLAREIEQSRQQRDLLELENSYHLSDAVNLPDVFTEIVGADFFRHVTSLSVIGDSMNDAHMVKISGLTRLKSLDLQKTEVTDAGLVHLEGLSQLHVLWLSETRVTDAGLQHLEGLTQLQDLYLDGTQVTDAGIDRLKVALPKCKVFH